MLQRDVKHRNFVPGVRPVPPFPKLSALTGLQQYQYLKVLCAQNSHILEAEFIPRPTKQDYKVFEVSTIYCLVINIQTIQCFLI